MYYVDYFYNFHLAIPSELDNTFIYSLLINIQNLFQTHLSNKYEMNMTEFILALIRFEFAVHAIFTIKKKTTFFYSHVSF